MKPNEHANTLDKKTSASLQRRLERHFLTCSAAVGTVAAFAPAPEAQAGIHYFNPPDIQIPLNDADGIYINLETGAIGTTGNAVPGWDINFFQPPVNPPNNPSTGLFTFDRTTTGVVGYFNDPFYYAYKLSAGTQIGGASPFVFPPNGITTMSYLAPPGGQWQGTTDGYVGVQFQLGDNATFVFGWIHVMVQNSINAQVTDWAWEDTGNAIAAGAVPEPSSMALSLLAAGAAGLAYWRRRKSAAAK